MIMSDIVRSASVSLAKSNLREYVQSCTELCKHFYISTVRMCTCICI